MRASLAAVNAALCAAIGERAVPLFGDEIGLWATQILAQYGLVGDPVRRTYPQSTGCSTTAPAQNPI